MPTYSCEVIHSPWITFFRKPLDKTPFVCYIILMIKNGKLQNVVPTTRKQNLAAAKACDDHYTACSLFRALQYANNMGTGEDHFDELEEHFIAKQGLGNYIRNGLTVAQASDKDAKDPEAYREYGVPTARTK